MRRTQPVQGTDARPSTTTLRPGEKIIAGRIHYSAAWLSKTPEHADRLVERRLVPVAPGD